MRLEASDRRVVLAERTSVIKTANLRGSLRVVCMGGGTGLATLLKGLKRYTSCIGRNQGRGSITAENSKALQIGELTAVVAVSDDGGSSGRLRLELNVPPPGDIRNCLLALAEDETVLSRLFQFRFPANSNASGLEGHSLGNLLLAALTVVTGDFAEAVRQSSAMLASCGHIFPVTAADVHLVAEMDDGSRVQGETSITANPRRIVRLELLPLDVQPIPQTLAAIAEADLITIGPGSLFTSLVPNLLVRGIPEAIATSSALKVFVCNLMTQANESLGLSAADHVRVLYEHAKLPIFDYALVNRTPISPELEAKYALERGSQVIPDIHAIEALGVKVIEGDYLEEEAVARHASDRVACDLLKLVSTLAVDRNLHVPSFAESVQANRSQGEATQ
jgi:uncharacterized cofD-like protein